MSANEGDADLPKDFPEDAHAFVAISHHMAALTPALADALGLEPGGHVGFEPGDEIPRSHAANTWEQFAGTSFVGVDSAGNRVDRDNPSRVAAPPSKRTEREENIRSTITKWRNGDGFQLGEDDPHERGMIRASHPPETTRHEREQQAKEDEHIAEIAARAARAVLESSTDAPAEPADPAFVCEKCGASFESIKALSGHMKAHSGDTHDESDPEVSDD